MLPLQTSSLRTALGWARVLGPLSPLFLLFVGLELAAQGVVGVTEVEGLGMP